MGRGSLKFTYSVQMHYHNEDDFLEYDEDDGDDDDDIFDINNEYSHKSRQQEEKPQNQQSASGRVNLRAYLRNKSKEDLIALVEDLATAHAEVRQGLWIRVSVAAGQFKELVQYVRKEIDSITEEEAWYDRLRQEGFLPDYSGVRDGLRELLDAGRIDDVVALGTRLFRRAQEQVVMFHDDVAQAVAKRYPDETIAIWKRLVKGFIAQTKPAAYRSAVPYLKKIKGLLERTGRKSEWDRFLNAVRVENARKRKLQEILDGMTNKPLIES